MSKKTDIFKSKKFLTGIAVGASVIIVGSSTLGIMLPSYFSWKEYYDAAIADRDYQKYLQTLPLEITGLSASLNDNVTYYDNGKAAPQNSDFAVIAHFTEKGRAFDEILQPNVYDITVPDDFVTDGGTVRISYAWTPPADETESEGDTDVETDGETETPDTPEPKVLTAEVECSLEDVVPVGIAVKNTPYRVYYSDDMAFDTDGMTATVSFNDGHTEVVANEFSASVEKLAVGTESVRIIWARGGTELPLDLPVTVVAKADYTDGDIYALESEGSLYIAHGAKTSEAKPNIRASYFNGNRLPLRDDQYTVTGNVDTASFTKKCILTVLLKSDASVFTRLAATVKTGIEAEAAEFSGSKQEFTEDGVTYVVPQKGAVMAVGLSSDAVAKPDLSLRIAAAGDGESLALHENVKMTVNGRRVIIPRGTQVRCDGSFYDVVIPGAALKAENDNTIEFEFYGDDANKLMIDRLNIEAGYKGEFYASTEKYLTVTAEQGIPAKFDNEITKNWDTIGGRAYGHGICSDGTYIYIIGTSWAGGGVGRAAVVIKYDPVNKVRVAQSALTETAVLESTAGITYYDGKIIIYFMDGRKMYVPVDNFTEGCEFSEYSDFEFEGLEDAVLNDVYYNTTKQKFAVFSGSSVYIFDKDKKSVGGFSIAGEFASSKRMTGSADYIYVHYTVDGRYSPLVHVYDWNGNYIGKQSIPVSEDFLKANGIVALDGTNIQGLAVVNGDFYATMLRFRQKNGTTVVYDDSCCMLKVSMRKLSKRLDPAFTTSEYIYATADAGVSPSFGASPTTGEYGGVEGTTGYGMGGASDGEYLYFANNRDGNAATVISKVDPTDYSMVATSAKFSVSESVNQTDNSRMFVKDGTLYVVAGDVFSIALADFADGCVITKDEAMTALLSQNGAYTPKDAHYDEINDKYAVLANSGALYILNAAGAQQGENITPVYTGMAVSSVTGDQDNIYVSFKADFQNTLPLEVYSWSGDKLYSLNVNGISLGTYVDNASGQAVTKKYSYNIQSVYMHNGTMHATVCNWSGGNQTREIRAYDFTTSPDLSVFMNLETFMDYLAECYDSSVQPKFTAAPTIGDRGSINGTDMYAMGGASYGEYMYVANSRNGNAAFVISKVRISDMTVVAASNTVNVATAVADRDNSRLFIKDGTLYVVAGDVYSIALADFAAGCVIAKDEAMTALLSQNGAHILKSAYYNAKADKYIVLTDKTKNGNNPMYILNGDGSVAKSAFTQSYGDGLYTSSVCGDDEYFYLSHSKNSQATLPIHVFDWEGNLKFTLSVSGINLGQNSSGGMHNYNIQAIFMVNGKLHASVCTWDSGVNMFNDWTITPDLTVFDS